MSKQYIIGIDSGTQSTRAILFDIKGRRIAAGLAHHPPLQTPHPGWVEHGKDDIAGGVREALADMFSGYKGNKTDIAAVGIAAQRCVVIPLDKDGSMLHNPISWMDTRWQMNAASLGKITTNAQDPLYHGFFPCYSKANWFKYNAPEIYKKTAKYLGVSAYLGYIMTGNFYESLANSFGWPYDAANWSAYKGNTEIKLMGMRRDQIAEPVLPGTVIGTVTAGAAAELGLPEGIPVVMGTGDKQSELLGAGVIDPGQAYITLGTPSGMDLVSGDYKPRPDFTYATYLSACPKIYHCEVAVTNSYWLISWFCQNFGGDLVAEAESQGSSIEEMLDKEAEAVPAGSEGLVVQPDWSPSGSHPLSKGIYLGFDDRHKRGHMFRALLEGLIIQIKAGSKRASEQLDMPINELYIGGSGSRSNLCAQIIADVFGVPVHRIKEPENCSLGAAMCGAVGVGLYDDFSHAVQNMVAQFDLFQPDIERHAFYNALNKNVIEKIFPALEDVFKEMAELQTPAKDCPAGEGQPLQ